MSKQKSIIFVADFLVNDPKRGGAELHDNVVVEHFKSTGRSIFHNAPHVIVLYYRGVEKNNTIMIGLRANDAGIALTYGMLQAQSLGLGTCWIGMLQGTAPISKEILKILGIKGFILGAFTLGYPAVKYRRAPPRPQLKIKER